MQGELHVTISNYSEETHRTECSVSTHSWLQVQFSVPVPSLPASCSDGPPAELGTADAVPPQSRGA